MNITNPISFSWNSGSIFDRPFISHLCLSVLVALNTSHGGSLLHRITISFQQRHFYHLHFLVCAALWPVNQFLKMHIWFVCFLALFSLTFLCMNSIVFIFKNILKRNLSFQLVTALQQSTNIHNALIYMYPSKKKNPSLTTSPNSTSILFSQDSRSCMHLPGPVETCESEQNFCLSLSPFPLDTALQVWAAPLVTRFSP